MRQFPGSEQNKKHSQNKNQFHKTYSQHNDLYINLFSFSRHLKKGIPGQDVRGFAGFSETQNPRYERRGPGEGEFFCHGVLKAVPPGDGR